MNLTVHLCRSFKTALCKQDFCLRLILQLVSNTFLAFVYLTMTSKLLLIFEMSQYYPKHWLQVQINVYLYD